MKPKAVFFDMDGTLMDTSEGIFETALFSMAQMNLPVEEGTDLRKFVGPPLRECFRITFGIQDDNTLDQLVVIYKDRYAKVGSFKAHFYDGILDVLQCLRDNGIMVGIASMKGEAIIRKMVQFFKMEQYFDGIFGHEPSMGRNTKKDILLAGCKEFSVLPSQSVLVGDTLIDEKGALEAGARCIKVNWGFGFTPSDEGTISKAEEILSICCCKP